MNANRPRRHRLLGCDVVVAAGGAAVVDATTAVLGPAVGPDAPSASDTIHIEVGPLGQCDHVETLNGGEILRPFWQGRAAGGETIACLASPDVCVVEMPNLLRTTIDRSASTARIELCDAAGSYFLPHGLIPALAELMRPRGAYLIHAACLSDRKDRSLLVMGESTAGKTTTALALAGGEFELWADDSTFWRPAGPQVMGLPLACKVHRNTRRLLPWINSHASQPTQRDDEDRVALCRPPQADGPPLRPRLAIFLDGRSNGEHDVRELPEDQAVARLCRENVRALDPSAAGLAGATFAALCNLAATCRNITLSPGPDVQSLPALVQRLLDEEPSA
jgi:hypothetical protein